MNSTTKKNIKITNFEQFQKLVSCMDDYPHLATGSPAFGSSRASMELTWEAVAQKVNALGPPERSGSEWKKIWADQKCRLKKKISENTKELHGTGGGPCRVSNLTEMELDIDRICHLSSAAAPRGKDFGTLKNNNTSEVATTPQCCVVKKTPPRGNESNTTVTTTKENNFQRQQSADILTTQPQTITSIQKQTNLNTKHHQRKEPERLFRQERKRKNNDSTDKSEQLRLLRHQIANQDAALVVAREQAEAIKVIAQSTKVLAEALGDIVKHLKDDD